MTVTTDRVSQGIVGNGADTVLDFTIPYQSYTTLFAYRQIGTVMTLLRQSVDYTIVATASPQITVTLLIGGGSVFATPPDALTTIWVVRDTPIVQSAYDLTATSPWVPIPTEAAFDAVYLILQELDDKIGMAITVGGAPPPGGITIIPAADKYLKWDSTATIITTGTITDQMITDMNTRITNLENSISGIQTQIDNLETTVTNLGADLQAQITALSDHITLIQASVDDHAIRILALETAMGGLTDQAAAIADLEIRMDAIEAAIPPMQNDITALKAAVIVLDARVDELEAHNLTYRRVGRFILTDPVYPVDTDITGLVFDYDFTSSSILYLEIRRSAIGDERVELYIYSCSWANGIWNVNLTQGNIQTAPTGVNIVLVHNVVDRAVQLQFNAPVALPGTYDPNNSWIAWTAEDMVRI